MGFVNLADVKVQLSMTSATNDAALQGFLDAACDEVEQWVGPIAPRVITGEYVDLQGRTIFNELTTAGTRQFVLRWRPVQSLQAVVSAILSGVTYTVTDFYIDTNTGIVRRNDGGTIFGPLRVDYTAGYPANAVPAWAKEAATIITQHLWRTRRVAGVNVLSQTEEDTLAPGYGFLIPNQALGLLESHRNVPAIG